MVSEIKPPLLKGPWRSFYYFEVLNIWKTDILDLGGCARDFRNEKKVYQIKTTHYLMAQWAAHCSSICNCDKRKKLFVPQSDEHCRMPTDVSWESTVVKLYYCNVRMRGTVRPFRRLKKQQREPILECAWWRNSRKPDIWTFCRKRMKKGLHYCRREYCFSDHWNKHWNASQLC